MAAAIPTIEPVSFVAGDTVTWTKAFPDYPAPTWTLTYALRLAQGAGKVDVTATQDGTGFSVTLAATVTALMTAGQWAWAGYVTQGAERHQVATGLVTVEPNFAALDRTVDLRSPNKIAYDNAMAAWQQVKLGQTVMLKGRSWTQHNLKDLIVYVDRCKADYQAELNATHLDNTGIDPRHIKVRLSRGY